MGGGLHWSSLHLELPSGVASARDAAPALAELCSWLASLGVEAHIGSLKLRAKAPPTARLFCDSGKLGVARDALAKVGCRDAADEAVEGKNKGDSSDERKNKKQKKDKKKGKDRRKRKSSDGSKSSSDKSSKSDKSRAKKKKRKASKSKDSSSSSHDKKKTKKDKKNKDSSDEAKKDDSSGKPRAASECARRAP